MHNYHSANGSFPMGTTTAYPTPATAGRLGDLGLPGAPAALPGAEARLQRDQLQLECLAGDRGPRDEQHHLPPEAEYLRLPLRWADGPAQHQQLLRLHRHDGGQIHRQRPKPPGSSPRSRTYSIADVSDGTSNTVAYSEALVSTPPGVTPEKKWRDGPAVGSGAGAAYYAPRRDPATRGAAGGLATLQHTCSRRNRIWDREGYRWGLSGVGDRSSRPWSRPTRMTIPGMRAGWIVPVAGPCRADTTTPPAITPAA